MSPRASGSWPGSAPSRKARASSGSAYPRRTSTAASVALIPSSSRSARSSSGGHVPIVHGEESIGRSRVRRQPDGASARRSLLWQLHPEVGEEDDDTDEREGADPDDSLVLDVAHGVHEGADEQDQDGGDDPRADDDRRGEDQQPLPALSRGEHAQTVSWGPGLMADTNYSSGDDYIVEFLGYRFTFNACDFEQRVVAAASKLGLVEANELDDDETHDLVTLAAQGMIDEAQSRLGRYL